MHICFMTTSAHPYTKTPDPGALSLVFLLNYHKLVHILIKLFTQSSVVEQKIFTG